jgi:hypothetical protein
MEKKTDSKVKTHSTVASEIWEEIKEKPIEMFALPNQLVHMYCKPIEIEPNKCYLKTTASSVLPALEAALGSKFEVERSTHFLVVARKP